MGLCGTQESHCCWLGEAGECRFVQRTENPPFKWECSLRTKYGSWDAVHVSPEYQEYVKTWMLSVGYQIDCGDWPPKGMKCNDCGEVGRG